METHVKVVGILHIVFSAFGLLAAAIVVAVFGGLGVLSGDAQAASFLAVIASIVLLVLLVLSLPGFVGGLGVLGYHNWARILLLVVSALELLEFPIGTAIGAYSLWVLLNEDTARLFAGERGEPVHAPSSH